MDTPVINLVTPIAIDFTPSLDNTSFGWIDIQRTSYRDIYNACPPAQQAALMALFTAVWAGTDENQAIYDFIKANVAL